MPIRKEMAVLPLGQIKPYERNPRHNDAAVRAVKESIRQCGYVAPIIVDEGYNILAGHTRYRALQSLGRSECDVLICRGLSPLQKRKYRLLDNKTAELADWDIDLLAEELDGLDFDGFDFGFDKDLKVYDTHEPVDDVEEPELRDPSMQHNAFENQDVMQFPHTGFYGIPAMEPTQTTGNKFLRFMDWKEVRDPENYIAHFYYDDYKFISAWREPDKYLERLRQFKAVISPDFSLYTDFPRALQILSCYRRQWCGAYWQYQGLDVIPDVVWGDKESFSYCFDGIPEGGTVAVSSVGVKRDNNWNNREGDMFKAGFDEMIRRLSPTTILFYGDMIDGLEGNIIQIPSYYAEKRAMLNERARMKNG